MSTRRLRSSSRNLDVSDSVAAATTTSSVTPQITTPLVSTNAVTPLLSIQFPPGFGPQTHSSPESDTTIPTPVYSSITAREISGQASDSGRHNLDNMPRQHQLRNLPPVDEEGNSMVNEDEARLREYVSASVGAAQASIMREVQNMQLMLPQLIRESLRSERGSSFNNIDNHNNRQADRNFDYQTPFNNNFNRQPQVQRPQLDNPPRPQQQRHYPTHIPQPFFGNTPQNSFEQFPGFQNSPQFHEYRPIAPNQIEKWGIRYDGSNKSLTVEDFVFRVEALRQDYQCSWDVVMKGFHHLVTGPASTWFWSFRMEHPVCDWPTFKHHFVKKFRNFESDFEIQRRIMERRQAPNESPRIGE